MIAVSSDGDVTLRVEQQRLEWVLEEIARQSGWSDVKQRASPAIPRDLPVAAPAGPTGCAEGSMESPPQVAQLLELIERGSDEERYNAILQARSNGLSVPDGVLKDLFETHLSDRVRLLAFENYLESLSDSPDAMRSALEAALNVPSAAIQREAKLRLDELLENVRIDAALRQQDGR